MKTTARTTALLLSLLLAGGTLCACGDAQSSSDAQKENGTAVETDTAAEEQEDPFASARTAFDALPAHDLGGKDFVITAQAGDTSGISSK